MPAYVYPSAAELQLIERELVPRFQLADPIFQHFPTQTVNSHMLAWEQEDDYIGLQQVRGLDGAFPRVIKTGFRRFQMEPGVYGEFSDLNETELTAQRPPGEWPNATLDVTEMVRSRQEQLVQREIDRIRFILWTLAATGTFSIAGPNGAVLHTDTYTPQSGNAAVAWATVATATPIVDLRTIQAAGPARGTDFGAQAVAYMNRATFNKLMGNTNAADLGGRFSVLFNRTRSLEATNVVLQSEDLPSIRIYDDGYKTDAGTFTRFLANDKVVIFGARPGRGLAVGNYRFTRNMNNPSFAPGPYTEVIENRTPPKRVDVFRGHNGGPVIYFPGSIYILTVS